MVKYLNEENETQIIVEFTRKTRDGLTVKRFTKLFLTCGVCELCFDDHKMVLPVILKMTMVLCYY